MAAAATSSSAKRPGPGFESMSHFILDTEQLVVMLENMDFCSGERTGRFCLAEEGEVEPSDRETGKWRRAVIGSCTWVCGVSPQVLRTMRVKTVTKGRRSTLSPGKSYTVAIYFPLEIKNSNWLISLNKMISKCNF